ncbi:MAG: class I SAM-dependent methyltransferase [Deltaproteobacteria bacterium]|jgi:2-polyprenyl-3-methyl-5-hydroxy-6-metoxy-1,4-benzoquinol methylase|nr:class I SAM-dependent methyltransferase [Deltaproteobacteria bacterium]
MMPEDIVDSIQSLLSGVPPREAKHLHGNLLTLLQQGRSHKMSPVVASALKRKPKRLLDIGCGYGALAIFFAMRGIETVGIDLEERALEAGGALAAKLGIANVTFSRMDACAITSAGFDAAISTDFFEHLTYSAQPVHLRSVRQALNPGGIYTIRAPHRANIRQHREDHIGLPSFESLRQQATDAGFAVRFSVAHTAFTSPVCYHVPLERWIEAQKWSELAIYKGLQKCGLANVLAHLEKPNAPGQQ